MNMKLKFRHKVFLTILLNTFAIIICMVWIARYYATRNFDEYASKMESERIASIVDALGQLHQKARGWGPVVGAVGPWLERYGGPPRPPGPGSGFPYFPLPPPGPPIVIGHNDREPPPFHMHPPPPNGPFPEEYEKGTRFVLFDSNKRPLTMANPSSAEAYRLEPIIVDNQLVGWLGIGKREPLTHPLDAKFRKVQSQTFYTIGAIALGLAVLVTYLLSRHLLGPVKELAAGARALTSRRFETRIEVRSQDEFGQLAADFNRMVQALERYEQMRRQWIADIAHELRTPLAILRGELEAMQDGVREITPEALDSLHAEVLHVGRIVSDLHDLSLIESQGSEAEQTEVNPMIVLNDTLRSFSPRFEHREMRIEAADALTGRATIMADPVRLRQLFSNLLENTLRYADAPGVLKISSETVEGNLLLHFEDSGPGVPEECLERLFDRLYRIDRARSRALGGSGLGLAICKCIVEAFGGGIEASNVPGSGLKITVAFPVLGSGRG